MQNDIKQWDSLTQREQDVFLRVNTQLASLDSLQTPTMSQVMDYVRTPVLKPFFHDISERGRFIMNSIPIF